MRGATMPAILDTCAKADMSQVIAVMIVIIAIGIVMDIGVFGILERKVRRIWGLERA